MLPRGFNCTICITWTCSCLFRPPHHPSLHTPEYPLVKMLTFTSHPRWNKYESDTQSTRSLVNSLIGMGSKDNKTIGPVTCSSSHSKYPRAISWWSIGRFHILQRRKANNVANHPTRLADHAAPSEDGSHFNSCHHKSALVGKSRDYPIIC
jgi:hypothetical protein